MKRRIAFYLLFFFISALGDALALNYTPVVRNITSTDYSSSRQNWSLTQGTDGIIYVGNNTALLEYDNYIWERHTLPGKELVRSVHYALDGRIYCGAYKEFGYFEKTAAGMEYHSLTSLVEDRLVEHDEVWNILSDESDGKVYFQTFNSIYIYDGQKIESIDGINPLNLIKVGSEFYSQIISGDFVRLNGLSDLELVLPASSGIGHVVAAFRYNEGLLLLTENKGCYVLRDRILSPWHTEADSKLRNAQINRAVLTDDGSVVIGTISGGLFSFTKDGRLEWNLDLGSGLQNNTVLSLICDSDDNIWAALDDGISYIDRSSGIYIYQPKDRYIGMVYDMLKDGDAYYLATNQGMYHTGPDEFQKVPGLDGQNWCVERVNSRIYCGHNSGIYQIEGSKATPISSPGGGTFCAKKIVERDTTYLISGSYIKPCLYKSADDGTWEYIPTFDNCFQMLKNIEYNGHGYIWGTHFKKGLVRLSLSPDFRKINDEVVYDSLGEVSDTVFHVMKINGMMVFTNGGGFFTYDYIENKIVPMEVMNRDLPELGRVHQAVHVKDNYYWLVEEKGIALVDCQRDSYTIIRSLPYSAFGVSAEERSSVICDYATGTTYLLLNNMILRIDNERFMNPVRDRDIPLELVNVQILDKDGSFADLPLSESLKLNYNNSTVRFRLRYPVYSGFDIRVRYRLLGLDMGWTDMGREMRMITPHLRPGNYTFVAEAYAGDEILADTSIDFVIRRAWYVSVWMMILYLLVAVMIVVGVSKLSVLKANKENQRKLEHQKRKLQEQKEAMLEEDIRKKSKDLASMSLAVIAHNEVLDSILKEINEQHGNKAQSLDRIRRIVQSSLTSNNQQWEFFQSNFDRIHENFFRKLKDLYPDLTSTDLRLCALLRLNLSTKEIANMLNLTVRGVESARYRLRKKLGISAEARLTDFMINFK